MELATAAERFSVWPEISHRKRAENTWADDLTNERFDGWSTERRWRFNVADRLLILESELTQRVKGQARAVRSVSRAVRRARSGLRDQSRPIASFMFCGPTVSFMFFSLADNGLDGVPISPFYSSLHPRTTNHSENDRASVKQNCARPSQKHTLARRRYVEISSLLDERIYVPLVPRRFMVIHFSHLIFKSHLIPSFPPFHINQI